MTERNPPMRQQLIEARESIAAQLDAMRFRTAASCARGGAPDYRELTAQLEEQLREIDALLGEDAPAAPDINWAGRR